MGGGRTPCCDKSKVKTGPWSAAEDARLVAFIREHGHSNWRALPRQAGLLRCGKSCRLRWINYLRPDVKRGNFTPQEEETVIQLHKSLGNKWSKIASYLPGRTDNEIKNVWNTHLKKRARKNEANNSSSSESSEAKPEVTKQEPTTMTTNSPSSPSSNVSVSEPECNWKTGIESGFDEEFWTMLDSMGTGCSSTFGGKEEELKKWMDIFECELRLEGDGDQWLREEGVSQPLDYDGFSLWPPSPLLLDF